MRHRPLLVWTAAFAAGVGLCAEGRLPAKADNRTPRDPDFDPGDGRKRSNN